MSARQQGSDSVAPSVQSTAIGANPHFGVIGPEGVARLVERFYFHMDTLPEAAAIRALHPADLTPLREVLRRYLTEWLGGPPLYSSERGHPRLRRRHLPFRIGAGERDAWMRCMRTALGEVVMDAKLRAELEVAFFRLADFLRNDMDHAHHQHATTPASK
jgi:hemoglobin